MRNATQEEVAASIEAAKMDGGAGVITVCDFDFPVYVEGGYDE